MPITPVTNQIELISEDVKEIINYHPHWIIRKGNIILFVFLSLLLLSTWLIRYPDIIQGPVRLIAINAPKLLTAKSDGKLERLLVNNEQTVFPGQELAFLNSTANHLQVLELEQWIRMLENETMDYNLSILLKRKLPQLNQLGELQPAFNEFHNIFFETIETLESGYYQNKRKNLEKDLQYIMAIQDNTQKQEKLLKEDMDLRLIEYRAKENLEKDKVIAPLELNQEKSKIIAHEQALQQLLAQSITNNITEHNKHKEVSELQKFMNDQQIKFRPSLLDLKGKVDEWLHRYVVISPIEGRVLFTSFLQENQLLSMDQDLFYIQPPQSKFYGELLASQNGLGKLKKGQKVLMKIASHPSEEFGYLTGQIGYISNYPTSKDSFLIKIDLPEGLWTNYNKPILFRNNLLARGEVITDNRRLFDRLWGQVRQITSR